MLDQRLRAQHRLELTTGLDNCPLTAPALETFVVPFLRGALGAEAGAFTVVRHELGYSLSEAAGFFAVRQHRERLARCVEQGLCKVDESERGDKNAVRELVPEELNHLPVWRDVLVPAGLVNVQLLHALLVEEGRPLVWLGCWRGERFLRHEVDLIQALIRPVLNRLGVEEAVRAATVRGEALQALLDRHPAPAYLLGAAGQVLLANAHGHELAAETLAERIAATAGQATGYERVMLEQGQVLLLMKPRNGRRAAALEQAVAAGLSRREKAVYELILEGFSNKEIAQRLRCSPKTVEGHVTRLLRKLDVESRVELIADCWRRS